MRRFLIVTISIIGILLTFKLIISQPSQRLEQEIEPQLTVEVKINGSASTKCSGIPQVELPKSSISVKQLALIVNDNDAQSVAVAKYYQQKRNIPLNNIVHVKFQAGIDEISPDIFKAIKSEVDTNLDREIQAIDLSFTRPFRVGCMSITSAFSLGYDDDFCQPQPKRIGCRYPKIIPYYDNHSVAPFTDLGIRPSMMLAGEDTVQVMRLIDGGIKSDASFPKATGYAIATTDKTRSVRAEEFSELAKTWSNDSGWKIQYQNNSVGGILSNFIVHKNNVLFYFTGLARVPLIQSNRYLPGAIADHLTSFGGVLFNSPQMSILSWLKAGAIASYGTVVEPCNFVFKFPDPRILVKNYYSGQTAIEAYWKSVASPYEGVFVGDPLAKPMGVKKSLINGQLVVKLSTLQPGKTYQVYSASTPEGRYSPSSELITLSSYQVVEIKFGCERLYHKLVEVPSLPGV